MPVVPATWEAEMEGGSLEPCVNGGGCPGSWCLEQRMNKTQKQSKKGKNGFTADESTLHSVGAEGSKALLQSFREFKHHLLGVRPM